jgi:hypothetical protein
MEFSRPAQMGQFPDGFAFTGGVNFPMGLPINFCGGTWELIGLIFVTQSVQGILDNGRNNALHNWYTSFGF